MLVWVDESGSNLKDMLRKYGYALNGEWAVCPRPPVDLLNSCHEYRKNTSSWADKRICIWGKLFWLCPWQFDSRDVALKSTSSFCSLLSSPCTSYYSCWFFPVLHCCLLVLALSVAFKPTGLLFWVCSLPSSPSTSCYSCWFFLCSLLSSRLRSLCLLGL